MEKPETPAQQQRRRWINIGEIVAVAGLIISGLALWNSWGRGGDKPPVVVEKERAIPLVLRGTVEDDGKALRLAPLEAGHALDTVTLTAKAPASGTASFGSEPMISASGVEEWLPKDARTDKTGNVNVEIVARYVEHGQTRTARRAYVITYGWTDGGLFSGKSLRLTGLSRI